LEATWQFSGWLSKANLEAETNSIREQMLCRWDSGWTPV